MIDGIVRILLAPLAVLARRRGGPARPRPEPAEAWEQAWPRPARGDEGLFAFLAGILRRRLPAWLGVLGLEAGSSLVTGATTYALSRLAGIFDGTPASPALGFLWVFLLLRLLQLALELGGNLLRIAMRTEMGCALRQDVLRQVLRFPMGFFCRLEHGMIVEHVNRDVAVTIDMATRFWLTAYKSLFTAACVSSVVLWLDWKIALWVFALALGSLPLIQSARQRVARIGKRLFTVNGRILSLLQETLFAIKYVKAMGIEGPESRRLGALLEENRRAEIKAAVTHHSIGPLLEFVYLLLACVALASTFVLFPGRLRLEIVMPLAYGLLKVFGQIRGLTNMVVGFDQSWQSVQRVYWTHAFSPVLARPLPAAARRPDVPLREIEFRDVTFGFAPNAPCLKRASFRLARGKLVALVGESGCGKTTVCDLLMGLYEEYEGSIWIDGVRMSELDGAACRSLLAYVPQEPLLIRDTVRHNLLYGLDRGATDEELVDALAKANAWDFVRQLPGGMEGSLSERGGSLSGGERQRLCLARALLRRPQLLVLDEATSMLDAQNEIALLDVLDAIKRDMMVLFVSHRMRVLDYADQVLMIEDGVIREVVRPAGSRRQGAGRGTSHA